MVKNKSKPIKQQLEDVQSLILENLYLQEKYPDKKLELELGLKSLKEFESEMFEILNKTKSKPKSLRCRYDDWRRAFACL